MLSAAICECHLKVKILSPTYDLFFFWRLFSCCFSLICFCVPVKWFCSVILQCSQTRWDKAQSTGFLPTCYHSVVLTLEFCSLYNIAQLQDLLVKNTKVIDSRQKFLINGVNCMHLGLGSQVSDSCLPLLVSAVDLHAVFTVLDCKVHFLHVKY